MKNEHHWARLLAYVTALVNHELLLKNEYLAAENRISAGSSASPAPIDRS